MIHMLHVEAHNVKCKDKYKMCKIDQHQHVLSLSHYMPLNVMKSKFDKKPWRVVQNDRVFVVQENVFRRKS